MDALQTLLLILLVASTSEGSVNSTCEPYDLEPFLLLEGEAFYFVPDIFDIVKVPPKEEFTWYKTTSKVEAVSSDERDRVHYHGEALFLLDLRPEDSGLYTAQHVDSSGSCRNYYLNATVFNTSYKNSSDFLYGQIRNADVNKKVTCPDPVMKPCEKFEGNLTWYKNFNPLKGEHERLLWVLQATKKDEGIYTCVCSWTYNNKVYNSSGSRLLRLKARPEIFGPKILSPNQKEPFAEEGLGFTINCSVLCDSNDQFCHARWDINGKPFQQMPGYNQTTQIVAGRPSHGRVSTATLTIDKVSAEDFQAEFTCIGLGSYSVNSTTLRIRSKRSVGPVVLRGLCVLLFCLIVAVLVRCFAMDLALVLRPYFSASRRSKDVRLYDAYVVYQTQGLDKAPEDTLCQFISSTLPSVLEEKCGYRLFIHGRDDKPGEDNVELAEDRMKQSRRLMVILPSGSETQAEITEKSPALPQNSEIGGFDWQVGLRHTLVQRDSNVILIQLGDLGPKGYTYLCPNLQRLIHQRAPLIWKEGSHGAAAWNSNFWKRVRYLMPAVPVRKQPHYSVV